MPGCGGLLAGEGVEEGVCVGHGGGVWEGGEVGADEGDPRDCVPG